MNLALAQTDARVREDKPVSPAFLFAALLWHEVLAAWRAREANGERPVPALFEAMDDVIELQTGKLAIPRRLDRDDEGDLVAAAAVRPALGQAAVRPGRRIPASARVTTS